VVLGQGEVIPGWDEGLIGATIGERRHLVIGSDNAYGSTGQGEIPPDAPLAFDVDVVDIQPAAG
jgi:FK506-binding protein 2